MFLKSTLIGPMGIKPVELRDPSMNTLRDLSVLNARNGVYMQAQKGSGVSTLGSKAGPRCMLNRIQLLLASC